MITDAVFFGRSAEKESVVPAPAPRDDGAWPLCAASLCGCCCWGVGGFLGYISGADQQYMCGVEGGEANGPPLHGVVADNGYFSPYAGWGQDCQYLWHIHWGMTHTQAVNLLKNAPGSIEMQVRFYPNFPDCGQLEDS